MSKNENKNDKIEQKGYNLNDFIGNYISDSTTECFKLCVNDMSSKELSESERNCTIQCFSKFYYSYMNMGEILSNSSDEM